MSRARSIPTDMTKWRKRSSGTLRITYRTLGNKGMLRVAGMLRISLCDFNIQVDIKKNAPGAVNYFSLRMQQDQKWGRSLAFCVEQSVHRWTFFNF